MNHSDSPLVTVQLMSCAKDVHLLRRAVASVMAQDLPPEQIHLPILFDGRPAAEEEKHVEEACAGAPFPIHFIHTDEPEGYYCGHRNRALPHAWGFYMAHLDADNEWTPDHLTGLIEAIRTPTEDGWPHFVYSRREYMADAEVPPETPLGPSPLVDWTDDSITLLRKSPKANFIDTGDFLIGKGALMEVAERTGCVWDSDMRRFGDWDLICRAAQAGLRGQAVDQVTHIYHWTGMNVQLTNTVLDIAAIPEEVYRRMTAAGLIKGAEG